MEVLLEIIILTVSEIFLEILVEGGLQSLGESFRRREERSPFLAFIGYGLLGVILGALSLIVFPSALVRSRQFHGISLRGISLIVAPLLGGAVMSGVGFLRRRKERPVIQLDSFADGAVFVFGIEIVRFLFTR